MPSGVQRLTSPITTRRAGQTPLARPTPDAQ
jgi:hypothetical protein